MHVLRISNPRSYESTTPDLSREAFASQILAKLEAEKLVPPGTRLDSKLPAELGEGTWGELLSSLIVDSDDDRRFDFDALELQRRLPGVHQQQLLRAFAKNPATGIAPPDDFGLAGHSELDLWRQQITLRGGGVLIDNGDEDGLVDNDDEIELVDVDRGEIASIKVGELQEEMRRGIVYNLTTARAAEKYAAQTPQISFTGGGTPDAVNTDFWTVSTAMTRRGSHTSWELNRGVTPAEAIDDCFGSNAGLYATECAHGRTLLRLKGLLDYDRVTLGDRDAGDYRFSARFAADVEQAEAAEKYVSNWRESGDDWADYIEEYPPPRVDHALEISRHLILGSGELEASPFIEVRAAPAAGDNGYFHNFGVSVSGVRSGWVGENVIDLGYRDGVQRFYGHPVGVQSEEEWIRTLAGSQVDSMKDYEQYFEIKFHDEETQTSLVREYRRVLMNETLPGSSGELAKLFASQPVDAAAVVEHLSPRGHARLARFASGEGLEMFDEDQATRAAAVLERVLEDRARVSEGVLLASRARIVDDVREGGPLASRAALESWLASPEAADWSKPRQLDQLSLDDVAELVERVMPEVRGAVTVYGSVNGGGEPLSAQMARFLKEGKVPEAIYTPEPHLIPR